MRLAFVPLSLAVVMASCLCASADDEDAAALPSAQVMPCEEKCGTFVPAKHQTNRLPSWSPQHSGGYIEALVQIRYNIGKDGLVHDAVILSVTGSPEFADMALRAVKEWTFEPATLDGNPVTESRLLNFVFDAQGYTPGARSSVVEVYNRALDLIKSGKLDEAEAKLKEQQAREELNFYERGMLAYLMGTIAIQRKDYQGAEDQVKLATDFYTSDLPTPVTTQLYKIRIVASLATGNLMDAMGATNRLKNLKGFDPNDPITKVVADTRARLDTLPEFVLSGRIPEPKAAANANNALIAAADAAPTRILLNAQMLYLYRRDFSFKNIVGSVDKFQLSCKQQTVESRITVGAVWHVPKNWSQCYLFVTGTPGSTFEVSQFAPETAAGSAAKP